MIRFGLYVDIGTDRDGLVHVKDVSKDYFIQKLETKFIVGQDIDVWIKFVDSRNNKLGLQMYPMQTVDITQGSTMLDLKSLAVESAFTGVVKKVSTYGVYVDFGADRDGFLHRRKMKITLRMRSFKPWEVHPVGSTVSGFIYNVDSARGRIELTTYEPLQWGEKIPMKLEGQSSLIDDDEEQGGSARASNFKRFGANALLNGEDDDDDGNEYDDDEDDYASGDLSKLDTLESDETEQVMSLAELKAVTAGSRYTQMLIDDTGGDVDAGKQGSNSRKKNGRAGSEPSVDEVMAEASSKRRTAAVPEDDDVGMEISVEELFDELSHGRDYLTIKDVKRWDYLQQFLKDGELTEVDVNELLEETGTAGKLELDEFEDFVDAMVDRLGLVEEGSDEEYDDDEEEDYVEILEDSGSKFDPVVMLDDSEEGARGRGGDDEDSSSNSKRGSTEGSDEFEDFDSISSDDAVDDSIERELLGKQEKEDDPKQLQAGIDGLSDSTAAATGAAGTKKKNASSDENKNGKSLSEHFEQKSGTNDLLQYLFASVAGKKGYAVLEDMLQWEFVRALIEDGSTDEAAVRSMYANAQNKKTGNLNIREFEALLDAFSAIDPLDKKNDNSASSSAASLSGKDGLKISSSLKDGAEIDGNVNIEDDEDVYDDDDDDEYDDEGEDEITVEEAFAELSQGKKEATFKAVESWSVISELLEGGALTRDDFAELFKQAGGRATKIDLEGFEVLLDLLG